MLVDLELNYSHRYLYLYRKRSSYPLVMSKQLLKMTIEIVSFPMKNAGSFHRFLVNVYRRPGREINQNDTPGPFLKCHDDQDPIVSFPFGGRAASLQYGRCQRQGEDDGTVYSLIIID